MQSNSYLLKVFATTIGFFFFFAWIATMHITVVALMSLALSVVFWLEMDFSIIRRILASMLTLYVDIKKERVNNGKKKT